MTPEARKLADILERERAAARRADIDALVALQADKREALAALVSEELSEEEHGALATAVRANISLIRHLVQCLEGMAGGGAQNGYNASGERTSVAPAGALRGRL